MTANDNTPGTKKSVSFGGTVIIKAVEEEEEVRTLPPKHIIWWQEQELNQILTADLRMLSRVGGGYDDDDDQRGLECYFNHKKNGGNRQKRRRRIMTNTEYSRCVVQRYRMLSRINGFLPSLMMRNKEKSLQKYCTKHSRLNQIQAIQMAIKDAEDAHEIQQQQQQMMVVTKNPAAVELQSPQAAAAAAGVEGKQKMDDDDDDVVMTKGQNLHCRQKCNNYYRDSIIIASKQQPQQVISLISC